MYRLSVFHCSTRRGYIAAHQKPKMGMHMTMMMRLASTTLQRGRMRHSGTIELGDRWLQNRRKETHLRDRARSGRLAR